MEGLSLQPLTMLQSDASSVPRISCTLLNDPELSLSMSHVTQMKTLVPLPSLPHYFDLMYMFNAHINGRILTTLIFCSKLSHEAISIKSFKSRVSFAIQLN